MELNRLKFRLNEVLLTLDSQKHLGEARVGLIIGGTSKTATEVVSLN